MSAYATYPDPFQQRTPFASRSGFLARMTDAVWHLKEAIQHWAERRAERADVRNLLLLENWALEDMGLTRADIYNALELAPNRSPKAYLAHRRGTQFKSMGLHLNGA